MKSGALSCLLIYSCSAMDRHMQHSVFHTIAFLAFSCLAFSTLQHGAAFSCLAISTLASWCRKFMSRIFNVPRLPFLCIFTNLELQKRYLPIIRGAGTPFPCILRHFNQFITNAPLKMHPYIAWSVTIINQLGGVAAGNVRRWHGETRIYFIVFAARHFLR